MLQFISRLVHLAFGSSQLRPYEQICIDAWRSTLAEVSRQKLDAQLDKFDFIQRQARGTKSVFYCIRNPNYETWGEGLLFPNRDEDQEVFAGKLVGKIGDVTESVSFGVYLHRGRLSSIEFSSEPGALATIAESLVVETIRDTHE